MLSAWANGRMPAVADRARRIDGGAIAALAAVVLAGSVIGYRMWGERRPEAPVARLRSADPLAQLERRTTAEPGNAKAWQQLALAYFNEDRFAEAVVSYRRGISLDPANAVLWSSLGEALVMASAHDPMPSEARQAFARAAALDPKDPRTRYFLAVEKDLSGNHQGAIDAWSALLGDTPAGAPWEQDLRRTIEQVGKINHIDVATRVAAATASRSAAVTAIPAVPGPSAEQLAAAAAISPSEQQAMAEAMVARLAARVTREPRNVEGWIMLMRSYKTLGREGDARAALAKAKSANPQAASQLTAAAATLQVS